jgi:hypothetical protein
MPEQLTKYSEVTIHVLRSAGCVTSKQCVLSKSRKNGRN